MILPGLISVAFYRRRPSTAQVVLGVAATVVLSALLGYVSPPGPLTQLGSVVVAIAGGVLLYVGVLLYLVYRYQPRHAAAVASHPPATSP